MIMFLNAKGIGWYETQVINNKIETLVYINLSKAKLYQNVNTVLG